jgi:hypothetical protein
MKGYFDEPVAAGYLIPGDPQARRLRPLHARR